MSVAMNPAQPLRPLGPQLEQRIEWKHPAIHQPLQHYRRQILTENAMGAIDELLSELKRSNRGLRCPRHTETIPTLCPMCALVECRSRLKGHPDYRSAV